MSRSVSSVEDYSSWHGQDFTETCVLFILLLITLSIAASLTLTLPVIPRAAATFLYLWFILLQSSSSIIIDIILFTALSPLFPSVLSPYIHIHTVAACHLTAFASPTIPHPHLKMWPLMDWKSWGRGNSHLKINVSLSILKGSQPSFFVCIYTCVCPVEDMYMSSLQCPLHYQSLGMDSEEDARQGLAHASTHHSLSFSSQYTLVYG